MRKNRNNNAKKERIIMIASSAFVLAALTMTGVYMQSRDQELENDGYTIDFSTLENSVDDKSREIAQNLVDETNILGSQADNTTAMEDDLEDLPMEAGSSLIEIPGLTDRDRDEDSTTGRQASTNESMTGESVTGSSAETEDIGGTGAASENPGTEAAQETREIAAYEATSGGGIVVTPELHYAENEGLLRPLSGETLIPFSMEKSVYFTTLDQYKRNTALIISAAEGTSVQACAEGRVIDIFQNEEIGHAVTMELGDGYQITYGQLRDIQVSVGSYVNLGDTIASVAKPTKYYVREGSNLYLKLTANGTPVDPEGLFY